MKPHLLYIAFWYPPSRASGVYRALATTKAFVDAEWDVTVVTTNEEFLTDEIGSVDPSLIDFIPSEVDVIRVPFAFDVIYTTDIRKLGRLRANFPTIWSYVFRTFAPLRRVRAVMRGASPHAHSIADKYVAWIDPVVKEGIRTHAKKRFDHILATGNPYSAFEAAHLISTMTGVGFSLDYRDPWTIDVFTGDLDFADRQTTAAESEIMAAATLSFHVNEPIAAAYRAKYPENADKQLVVYNGYDPESVPPPSGPSSEPLVFGILGTLNDRWPTKPIFKAWAGLYAELPKGSQLVLGGHLGYFEHSEAVLEAYLPDESLGFHYAGAVSKSNVADFYASLDVVILPVPGGPMVSSGKVFEVMALGKPVVCVQASGGGARTLLDDRPLIFGADPDVESVRKSLLAAADAALALDQETSKDAQLGAAMFERDRTISTIVKAVSISIGAVRSE
jgi:glycosyltransferase involved in cell wall biosynthesis